MRVALQRCGEAAATEREPDVPGAQQRLDVATDWSLEPFVAPLDPNHDLRDRQHVLQVDEDRGGAVALRGAEHAPQQRRLAVAPRPHEAKGMAARGEREQVVSLAVSV